MLYLSTLIGADNNFRQKGIKQYEKLKHRGVLNPDVFYLHVYASSITR